MDSKKMNSKSKLNFENIVLLIIIALGVTFAIYQFLYNRSLWLDESYLALNIINRNFLELLQPLDYKQVAPILFLYIEKLFTIIFGVSEYALRVFPLLSYLASLYFLFKILRVLEVNIYSTILSLSLFVFNGTVIYYSSEVKQYSTDMLVATYMFFFTIKNYKNGSQKYILLGILGIVSIFLSNVSPIILLCCGVYLLYHDFKNSWSDFKNILTISIAWVLTFGVYFIFFIHDHPTREFMIRYWSYWAGGSFLPLHPEKIEFYEFIIRKYNSFYTELFQFGKIGFYGLQLLFLTGCYHLIKKNKLNVFVITIVPIVLHLVLSSFQLYPFDTRLILYTGPGFVILLSYGFDYIFNVIRNQNLIILKLAFAIIATFSIYTAYSKIPLKSDEPRESFFYIKENIKENDEIFASHYSKFPFQYYIESSQVDFTKNEINFEAYGTFDDFKNEIVHFKGRVWFVFKDFIEFEKMEYMKEQYDDGKHKLLDEYTTNGMTVLLYDISE